MDAYSVNDAARQLGVSPARIRAMIKAGDLAASRFGRAWLIDPVSVALLGSGDRPGGRPFEPANAWQIIFQASGLDAALASERVRWRLRRALDDQGLVGLRQRLRRRASILRLSAPRSEIAYVRESGSLVRSGISAARRYRLDLAAADEVDAYLPADQVDGLIDEFALRPAEGPANVVLRVVANAVWPFPDDAEVAPLAAVALDLADDIDPRSSRVGQLALEKLDAEARAAH